MTKLFWSSQAFEFGYTILLEINYQNYFSHKFCILLHINGNFFLISKNDFKNILCQLTLRWKIKNSLLERLGGVSKKKRINL